MHNDAAILEAVLYLETEPRDIATLSRITGLETARIEAALELLRERFSGEDTGMELCAVSGGVMLSPKKELWEVLRERYGKKNEAKLSRAAMETLAIIAYSQPVTRSEIESIRGVQADNMIRILFERDLIREVGKKDIPGRPMEYGTTKEFLRFFRMESLADLPKLPEADADKFELESEPSGNTD
ncbi:MAG: SMC-Scp complex subunit ScpB [Spirochaetaceae bacterium]|jgi:segregation and condensation protein B|nr:SMC-Scp complex subunit ScpB [Spirochaetaceae bacterium]